MADRRIDIDIVGNDKASSVFREVSNGLNTMSTESTNAITRLDSGLRKYNNAMSGLYRATQVALTGAGYLVYKFTKDSINAFAEFEQQHAQTMGAIATNYDKTAESQRKFMEDQQKLKQQAIELGTWGPNNQGALYNPTQVASTQTALVKAGFKPGETQSVIEPIIKFAGGNNLQLETASDYAVNVAEMFGVKRDKESYTKMLNQITKAADISTIDVPDLFDSLKYAGGIASSLKRPLTEVLSMIAVMGNAGLKGSMAGTGIQAFFTRILNPNTQKSIGIAPAPSDKVQQVLNDFTKQVTDSKGNFKDMPTVTGKLDDAMSGLNDKEQAWFAQKLFGLFQMKAAFTLARNGGSPLQNVMDQINNNSGGANDLKWDLMLNSAYGAKERLANAWSGIKVDFGYRLQPFTSAIMDELFKVFANKGNYKINFNTIQAKLKETSNMITDQYGQQLGNLVYQLGNFGIGSAQILDAIKPEFGGIGLGFAKLLGGDIPGALKAFKDGMDGANKGIEGLPDGLKEMGRQVRNAIAALATLAGLNFAAKIAGNLTSVGKFLADLHKTTSMNVTAGTVILKDTGLVDRNGTPIYTQEATNPRNKTTKETPGGTVVDLGGGRTKTVKETPRTIVDANGNPISSTTKEAPVTFGSKVGSALGKASWIYAIGEMLGVNDWILDRTGAKEGTKARSVIDKGRNVVDTTMTASFLDDIILKGALKTGLKDIVVELGPAIGREVVTGIASLGVGGTVLGGGVLAAGTYVLADQYIRNKETEQKVNKIHTDTAKGRHVYVDNDGNVVSMPSAKEQQDFNTKHKYDYNGGRSSEHIIGGVMPEPTALDWIKNPFTYLDKVKKYESSMNNYNATMKTIQDNETKSKMEFSLAQSVFKKNTGQKLDWNSYNSTKSIWDKIFPSGMFALNGKLNGSSTEINAAQSLIGMQSLFKQLSSVKVDKDGNVDAESLKKALAQMAKDSSGISLALLSIAKNGNALSSSIKQIQQRSVVFKKGALPGEGKSFQESLTLAQTAGKANGTGFDMGTFLKSYTSTTNSVVNNLKPVITGSSSVLNSSLSSKLDAVNNSINSKQLSVTVNNPAPNVAVYVDKNGNETVKSFVGDNNASTNYSRNRTRYAY